MRCCEHQSRDPYRARSALAVEGPGDYIAVIERYCFAPFAPDARPSATNAAALARSSHPLAPILLAPDARATGCAEGIPA
jgi:hypothetical protein